MFKSIKSVTYNVEDVQKAKMWYHSILKSEPLFETPFVVIFQIGSCSLSLLQQEKQQKKSPHQTASKTTLFWEVESITESVNALQSMGAIIQVPVHTVMNTERAKLIDPFGNQFGISSTISNSADKKVEKSESETAMIVTFCRALAHCDERHEISGSDSLAHHFLSEQYQSAFKNQESRKWSREKLHSIYGYTLARNSYGDTLFSDALTDSIPQIVILGAGYDTRAYRYSELIKDTTIFEVDIAPTQARKRTVLEQKEITIPSTVHFISHNFKNDSLLQSLENGGYNPALKTLFLWEGVLPYLTRDDVDKTLRVITNSSVSGSTIFFDYLTEQKDSQVESEPFLFWMDQYEMKEYLSQLNITVLESLTPIGIEQQYLTSDKEERIEPTMNSFQFVYGEVQ